MNRNIFSFSGMTIAAVALFFASGHMIGNQQVFAFGGYRAATLATVATLAMAATLATVATVATAQDTDYGPGYPIDNPCGGGPYSIINGQIVCTLR